MTTTPPPPPSSPAIETNRTASNVEDATPAEAAAAAAAEATLLPSTEDPQEDECVLCAYPLPLKKEESVYQACCGQMICYGCLIGQRRVLILGENVEKPIQGSKEEESEFMTVLAFNSEQPILCPFCRVDVAENDQERLKRIWERIDEYRDPEAMNMLGCCYIKGEYGLSKNILKGEALYKRAYDLGHANAARNLSVLYTEDIPDAARMIQYAEEGVRRGNVACMNDVGAHAHQSSGNTEEATRHFMMAARFGDDEAMQNLTEYYRHELVSKEDLATTLRAHQAAHDKGKSESREYARRYWDFRAKALAAGEITMGDYTLYRK